MFSQGGLAEPQSQSAVHVSALSPLIISSSKDQEMFKIPQNIDQNTQWKIKNLTSKQNPIIWFR